MKPDRIHPDEAWIGLVSVSDRASKGVYADEGLPSLRAWLTAAVTTPIHFVERLIPDEKELISATLRELVDTVGCDLVLTTGGTGPARRDVTPEATEAVATRIMPGFGEQMRRISSAFVPTAILSRQIGALREAEDHAALIINLPGRPKAIAETLGGLSGADGSPRIDGIFAAVPYCIDLIGGPYIETDPQVCAAFRPKNARRPKPQRPDVPFLELANGDRPDCTIILLHGMGCQSEDFEPLAQDLAGLLPGHRVRTLLPQAPVRFVACAGGQLPAWFGMRRFDEADPGDVAESAALVDRLIAYEVARGMPRCRIFLAGFSQGACIALYAAMRQSEPLGGAIAFSGFLPGADRMHGELTAGGQLTPVLMCHGTLDDVISLPVAAASAKVLSSLGVQVELKTGDFSHEVIPEHEKAAAGFIAAALGKIG